MERWQRNLEFSATGVMAAALVELLGGSRHSRLESISRCLLAGGVAFAYAQVIPPRQWGVKSGASFAQLPWIASVEESLGGSRPLELACWGGLTGLFLKLLRP
ncbi:MAG: hypothetical protein ACRD04_11575 [Terriglobales bacterium]